MPTSKFAISGGTVSAAVTVDWHSVSVFNDGSTAVPISVSLNGAHRVRMLRVSTDGSSVMIDSHAIGSLPPALQSFASALAALPALGDAALSLQQIIDLLTSP